MCESHYEIKTKDDIIYFNSVMNTWKQGFVAGGTIVHSIDDEDYSLYRTLSISKFEKFMCGIFWDYVNYESYVLSLNNIEHKCFFIRHELSEKCHSFVVIKWGREGYIAFESYLKDHAGISSFPYSKSYYDAVVSLSDLFVESKSTDVLVYEYKTNGLDEGLCYTDVVDKVTKGDNGKFLGKLSAIRESLV